MVLHSLPLLGVTLLLTALAHAQFPPTPRDVKVVQSQLEEGVRISYKEARDILLSPLTVFLSYLDQTVRDHGRRPKLFRLCSSSRRSTRRLGRPGSDV